VSRFAVALALVACGSSRGDQPQAIAAGDHLAQLVARELGARFGTLMSAHCDEPHATCTSALADGTPLTVRVTRDGAGWTWKLEGDFVDTAPIATYVDSLLVDLGVAQTASCAPRVARLPRGSRLACSLSGGGSAFVAVGSGGALAVELALDRNSAAARDDPATPAHDRELEARSRALAGADDDDDRP
jgi:hypothetical protein